MKLYAETEEYKLFHGSMLDMLEVITPKSIDSIVTDPPYELNFMNKGWDNSGIAFRKDTWRKCYEVLKPGGYLLAFGGSRTFHRIACAIEDAGFEIRDTIMWLYGSGFPKSMNIGNGWGTALKPAYEPIIVARKPVENSVVSNVLKYGVGGINIDECRIDTVEETRRAKGGYQQNGYVGGKYDAAKYNAFESREMNGRFPSNVILTYDETDFDEVCGNMPETSNSGGEVSQNDFSKYKGSMMNVSNRIGDAGRIANGYIAPADSGNACRYFYTAKASKKDRDEGLMAFNRITDNAGRHAPCDNAYRRGETPRRNVHPTVKPTELMQYLVRLVSPPGATILDCFNGSGSTGKAVLFENKERGANYKYIGIELTDEYLPIAKARLDYVANVWDFSEEVKTADGNHIQMSLFDEVQNEQTDI